MGEEAQADVPRFQPVPEYPDGEVPPWALPFDKAVAHLTSQGHDTALVRKALELAGSLELAEKLLRSRNVSEDGLRALNAGPPEVHFLDGIDAIRALKSVFDNHDLVRQLKGGTSVECDIPDGDGGVLTFVLTPKDAEIVLKGVVKKTLAEFQPGDSFRPDLKPFRVPEPEIDDPVQSDITAPVPDKVAVAPQPEGQVQGQVRVVDGPGRAAGPGYAAIRAAPASAPAFNALPADHQEAVAALVEEFGISGLLALEYYAKAQQDFNTAHALLQSVKG
jgi:hypothetical protein